MTDLPLPVFHKKSNRFYIPFYYTSKSLRDNKFIITVWCFFLVGSLLLMNVVASNLFQIIISGGLALYSSLVISRYARGRQKGLKWLRLTQNELSSLTIDRISDNEFIITFFDETKQKHLKIASSTMVPFVQAQCGDVTTKLSR